MIDIHREEYLREYQSNCRYMSLRERQKEDGYQLTAKDRKIVRDYLSEVDHLFYLKDEVVSKEDFWRIVGLRETLDLNHVLIRDCAYFLKFMDVQDDALGFKAISGSASVGLAYLKNKTYRHCLKAVSKYGRAIEHAPDKTEELCKIAVKNDGFAIVHIPNPSDEVKRLAVATDPGAIKYIDNPSNDLVYSALEGSPRVVFDLKDPREEWELFAIKKDHTLFQLKKNPSSSFCLEVLKFYPRALIFIENPTIEHMLLAVEADPTLVGVLENPPKKVRELAINKDFKSYSVIGVSRQHDCLLAAKKAKEHGGDPVYSPGVYFISTIANPGKRLKSYYLKHWPMSVSGIYKAPLDLWLKCLAEEKSTTEINSVLDTLRIGVGLDCLADDVLLYLDIKYDLNLSEQPFATDEDIFMLLDRGLVDYDDVPENLRTYKITEKYGKKSLLLKDLVI